MIGTIEEELAACRARFVGVKVGSWVRSCHHARLMERLTEPPENRIDFIIFRKPEHERAIRLHEFWPIPNDMAEEYWGKRNPIEDEYWDKRILIDVEYWKKLDTIAAPIIALVSDTTWNGKTITRPTK